MLSFPHCVKWEKGFGSKGKKDANKLNKMMGVFEEFKERRLMSFKVFDLCFCCVRFEQKQKQHKYTNL